MSKFPFLATTHFTLPKQIPEQALLQYLNDWVAKHRPSSQTQHGNTTQFTNAVYRLGIDRRYAQLRSFSWGSIALKPNSDGHWLVEFEGKITRIWVQIAIITTLFVVMGLVKGDLPATFWLIIVAILLLMGAMRLYGAFGIFPMYFKTLQHDILTHFNYNK
jgi:hypothetical protein